MKTILHWIDQFRDGPDGPPPGYKRYVGAVVKWVLAGVAIGLIGGFVGGAFHICVDEATQLRLRHPWLLYLLPLAGILIAVMYQSTKSGLDTNAVIRAIHTKNPVRAIMAPLIFLSTVLSHLCGASVGREGAALQIGGVIGYHVGKLTKLDERDEHILVMCGMSAVFAANFGTPVTAAVFSLEVTAVGILYYAGLIPCLLSSVVATSLAHMMGVEPLTFPAVTPWEFTALSVFQACLLGGLCGPLSVAFCYGLHFTEHALSKRCPNAIWRIAIGGAVIILLSLPTRMYNGAGIDVIANAIAGNARPWDFAAKMLFTVICVSTGYKGGEIIPTIFIGATFGCVVGQALGMDPGFSAAICAIALFCGMVNCPLTSMLLSIELFGAEGLVFFALAVAFSYVTSGSYSLYMEQSIVYSKLKAIYINRKTQ